MVRKILLPMVVLASCRSDPVPSAAPFISSPLSVVSSVPAPPYPSLPPTQSAQPIKRSQPPRTCIPGLQRPAPPTLSRAQLLRARTIIENENLDPSWLHLLDIALGGPSSPTSEPLSDGAIQRIAWFQRALQLSNAQIRVNGIIDSTTREAIVRAFPTLSEPTKAKPLPGCHLRWPGSTQEQRTFMMQVYDVQRWRASQKRPFSSADTNIAPIEEESTARKDAAQACRSLLTQARKSKPPKGDLQVVFGYRSPETQLEIWEYHFPARYKETASRRAGLPSGEHGPDAVLMLATLYAGRTASPGYSLHNTGTAIDFSCITGNGTFLGPTGKYLSGWKGSWCYRWLEAHAKDFGFTQNPRINEPWHWEFFGSS